FPDHRQGGFKVGRLDDLAAPASQKCFHAVEQGRYIVDAKRCEADELARDNAGILTRRQLDRWRICHWDGASEAHPAASSRLEANRAIEYACKSFHDGKAQAEPARNLSALIETMKFNKYVAPP